ncbi:ribonuclease H-like domain-containing protein [Xylaria venustula]|nr:ribonuclease H-like domain-containing protein [Xylaria venustula]
MATRFYPERYIGRALKAGETVECPMVLTGLYRNEMNSIIIAVDGACRNNGQPGAQAALGVFFCAGSSWNKAERLPLRDTTSQRAELCAALRALKIVYDSIAREWQHNITAGHALKRVIIKSDSNYLVQGMTEYIVKWRSNGFLNARSQPVQNQELIKELWQLIKRLQQQRKIKVLFWKVARQDNASADRLANAARDATRVPTWDYRGHSVMGPDPAIERVWIWHNRMAHAPLKELQLTLRMTKGMDITHEQIQAVIDKGVPCPVCVSCEMSFGS